MDLTQEDLNDLALLVKNGNTSGILDDEDETGKPTRITWSLKAEKWINN